jgi:hypothetical protein
LAVFVPALAVGCETVLDKRQAPRALAVNSFSGKQQPKTQSVETLMHDAAAAARDLIAAEKQKNCGKHLFLSLPFKMPAIVFTDWVK